MMELTPHQKGRVAEQVVADVLEELKQEGVIRGFRHTKRYSSEDRRGIDFLIFTKEKRIPIQVKASFAGKKLHEAYSRKVEVPCVVGKGEGLKAALVKIISQYSRGDCNGFAT
jgi:hypothetical protein